MTVNKRIREVRTILGLTQSRFADRIGISNSYLGELEHGKKNVNERVIKLLVAEFNVNEDWLRAGKNEMFNEGMDEKVAQLMNLFKMLNPHFQIFALRQLDELTELQKCMSDYGNLTSENN